MCRRSRSPRSAIGPWAAALVLAVAGVGCQDAGGSAAERGGPGATAPPAPATAPGAPATPPPAPAGGPLDTTPIRRVGVRERRRFGLLRRPAQPLPDHVRELLGEPAFGMNPALARRLPTQSGRRFWLVPGRDALCLVHSAAAGEAAAACAPTDVAVARGVVAVSLRDARKAAPAQRLVVGVVPDGVRVAFVHSGERTTRVPIRRDRLLVLRDDIAEPPDAVSFDGSAGPPPAPAPPGPPGDPAGAR